MEMPKQRVYLFCKETGLDTSTARMKRIRKAREPEIDSDKFIDLFNEGHNVRQIAKILRVRLASAYAFAKKKGLRRTRGMSNNDKKRIMELLEEDYLVGEIAQVLGRHYMTITNYLKKLGVKGLAKRACRIRRKRLITGAEKQLIEYLSKNGPTDITVLVQEVGCSLYRVRELRRNKKVDRFFFYFPKSTQSIQHKRIRIGPFLTLKDDPRIIEYITSKIDLKDLLKPYIADLSRHMSVAKAKAVFESLLQSI
jgi:transposase